MRKRKTIIWLVGAVLFLIFGMGTGPEQEEKGKMGFGRRMVQEISSTVGQAIYGQFTPCIAFVEQQNADTSWLFRKQVSSILPIYGYMTERAKDAGEDQFFSVKEVLLEEAEEGNLYVQGDGALNDEMEENNIDGHQGNAFGQYSDNGAQDATLAELLRAENEAALEMRSNLQRQIFYPHEQQTRVDMEALKDYETLLQEFYTVDANTMVGSNQLNLERFAEKDFTVSADTEGPQILIFHTHSQEAFADSVPGDVNTSIVGVGERLTEILQEDYGYEVLHHTGQYDVETRDDAYTNALPEIEKVLSENPSIQVVIDLHRDSMPEETRLVMDLDGRPTARFMFFNGLSRTKKTGNIAYLYNENLEDNLAFSFRMQKKAYEYYPGLTRKIYLKGYRYNMHLKEKFLLVELGAQNNTVEEAMNACDPLAHILHMVLSGQ